MNDNIVVNIENLTVRDDHSRLEPIPFTEETRTREIALSNINITLNITEKTLLLATLRAGKSLLLEIIRRSDPLKRDWSEFIQCKEKTEKDIPFEGEPCIYVSENIFFVPRYPYTLAERESSDIHRNLEDVLEESFGKQDRSYPGPENVFPIIDDPKDEAIPTLMNWAGGFLLASWQGVDNLVDNSYGSSPNEFEESFISFDRIIAMDQGVILNVEPELQIPGQFLDWICREDIGPFGNIKWRHFAENALTKRSV